VTPGPRCGWPAAGGAPHYGVHMYGITAETNGNRLVTIDDVLTATGGTFGTFTTLVTAPAGTVFRGVAFSPVPEPDRMLLLGAVGAGVVGFVRRWW
jgi:hypothetical protein